MIAVGIVKDPAWKRIASGLCGIGIMIAGLLLLRPHGTSGEEIQQWETVIVMVAAAAGVVLWVVKRRQTPRG